MTEPKRSLRQLASALYRDRRGELLSSTITLSGSMFLVGGIFLINTQLNKAYVQRDMVDHAASMAADAANKVLCASPNDFGGESLGSTGGQRAQAIQSAVQPVLDLVSQKDNCKIQVLQGDSEVSQVQPDQQYDVQVSCTIPCSIPFAAGKLCEGNPPSLSYKSKQAIKPNGCDMKESQ